MKRGLTGFDPFRRMCSTPVPLGKMTDIPLPEGE